jgi:hypothetical protein
MAKKNKLKPRVSIKGCAAENIKKLHVVKCVECPRNKILVSISACSKCDLHKHYTCLYEKEEAKIGVIPSSTAHKINRNIFEKLGEGIRDETLNYYVVTKILGGVKNPKGFANYTEAKEKFLRGEFGEPPCIDEKEEVAVAFKDINSSIILSITDKKKYDMVYNGKKYSICHDLSACVKSISSLSKWRVVYYLYNCYSLEGLGDIKINGASYKCLFSPVPNYPPDLVVLFHKKEDKLIIGSYK